MSYERVEKLLGCPENTKTAEGILEASYFKEHLILKFKNNRLNDFLGRDRVDGDILAIDAYTVEMPFVFAGPKVKEKAK